MLVMAVALQNTKLISHDLLISLRFFSSVSLSTSNFHHKTVLQDRRNEDNKVVENAKVMDKSRKYASFANMENVWKSVFATPYKWYDCRINKENQNASDFRNINTGEGLWIVSSTTPSWVKGKLIELGKEAFAPSSTQKLWEALFADPSEWFDNREIKESNKHPDFVHKVTRESIWIVDFKTPTWVTPMLKNIQGEPYASYLANENLWKICFSDPSKWFDNRKVKRSSKHPDFVHKDTHEALWIENVKNPPWVISRLDNLEDDAFIPSPTNENLWNTLFSNPSRWLDNRKTKKSIKQPDFIHKDTNEALWIDDVRCRTWVISLLNNLQDEAFSALLSTENLWNNYFSDPSKWLDNRKTKKNSKLPDFVHKYMREGLWIEGLKTPAWVLDKLNVQSPEKIWESFFVDPSQWLDNRKTKRRWNSPDFAHKHTGNGLWINSDLTPCWVAIKLNELPEFQGSDSDVLEPTWSALFANPSKWFDERVTKKNSRSPDFRHRETCQGLWIDNKSTPSWVISSLSKLGNEGFASTTANDRQPQFLFVDPSFLFDTKSGQKDDNASKFILKDSHDEQCVSFQKDESVQEFTLVKNHGQRK